MRHVVSFLKSPIGYIANFLATCACYLPRRVEDAIAGQWLANLCETFCLQDGVQDDPLF